MSSDERGEFSVFSPAVPKFHHGLPGRNLCDRVWSWTCEILHKLCARARRMYFPVPPCRSTAPWHPGAF